MGNSEKAKCPFCDSQHVLKDGFDDTSMDIWRCMACGETITQADLDAAKKLDDDDDDDDDDVKPGDWDDPHLTIYDDDGAIGEVGISDVGLFGVNDEYEEDDPEFDQYLIDNGLMRGPDDDVIHVGRDYS